MENSEGARGQSTQFSSCDREVLQAHFREHPAAEIFVNQDYFSTFSQVMMLLCLCVCLRLVQSFVTTPARPVLPCQTGNFPPENAWALCAGARGPSARRWRWAASAPAPHRYTKMSCFVSDCAPAVSLLQLRLLCILITTSSFRLPYAKAGANTFNGTPASQPLGHIRAAQSGAAAALAHPALVAMAGGARVLPFVQSGGGCLRAAKAPSRYVIFSLFFLYH